MASAMFVSSVGGVGAGGSGRRTRDGVVAMCGVGQEGGGVRGRVAGLVLAGALVSVGPGVAAGAEPAPVTITTPVDASAAAAAAAPTAPLSGATLKRLQQLSREHSRLSAQTGGGGLNALQQLYTNAKRAAEGGDFGAAIALYSELAERAPEFAPAFSNRANVLVAQQRYAQALSDYTKALQLAPLASDAWVVHLNRASTLTQLGRANTLDPTVQAAVQAALDADPNVIRALPERSSWSELALRDLAIATQLRGGVSASEEAVLLVNRAVVNASVGRWDAATVELQRAVEKSANDVQPFWLEYALLLYEKGRVPDAVAIANRVAAKFGSVDDVNAVLALLEFDQGNLANAETRWSALQRPRQFRSRAALSNDRHWPPRAIETLARFQKLTD